MVFSGFSMGKDLGEVRFVVAPASEGVARTTGGKCRALFVSLNRRHKVFNLPLKGVKYVNS